MNRRAIRRALVASAVVLSWAAAGTGVQADSPPERTPFRPLVQSWEQVVGIPGDIRGITQDRDGYIWVGTALGLLRFDGVQFARWTSNDGQTLPNNRVIALTAARDGSVWVSFGFAVSRLLNGTLTTYGALDGIHPVSTNRVLLTDHEGTVWAGGFGGVTRFRNNTWEAVAMPPGIQGDAAQVLAFFEDSHFNLLVATASGVLRRNASRDALEMIAPSLQVSDFAEDGDGEVWVAHAAGGYAPLSSALSPPSRPRRATRSAYKLLRDKRKHLWIGTRADGVRYTPSLNWGGTAPVQLITTKEGLTANDVSCLYEDREGNIWVGTSAGLNRIPAPGPLTIGHHQEPAEVAALAAAGDGSVWAITPAGLQQLTTGPDRRGLTHGATIATQGSRALHVDRTGTLWVADDDRGLTRYRNGRLEPVPLPASAPLTRIRAITSDGDGHLWLGDLTGIFELKDGALTNRSSALPGARVITGQADSRGRVWFGFAGGDVVVYDHEQMTSYSREQGLAKSGITAIYEDKTGGIWIGTGNGVSKLINGRFVTLTERDGIPGQSVIAIQEDDQGYIWLAVDLFLARFSKADLNDAFANRAHRPAYTLFDASDGLVGIPNALGWPTSARAGDGTLWFGTTNGIAIVDPRVEPGPRSRPSDTRIERVLVDDRTTYAAPQQALPPRTGRLEFEYTAPAFVSPTKVVFRYRLEGYDKEWVYAGPHRRAIYTNLPPDTYHFRVESSTYTGEWSGSTATWSFAIAPAFYQTYWFYAAVAALGILLVITAMRIRLRRVHAQYDLVLAERARMGREIHDTLLQGIVGASIQCRHIMGLVDSAPDLARERLDRAAAMLEYYTRETRQSVWELRSGGVTHGDLASALRELGDTILRGSDISFDVVVHGQPRPCPRRAEQHLLRIAGEAVTNSLRHAQPTHIRVELRYEGGSVTLHVSDDGCGFDTSSAARPGAFHYGLQTMPERAAQVQGRFTLSSTIGAGTDIRVIVPLSGEGV